MQLIKIIYKEERANSNFHPIFRPFGCFISFSTLHFSFSRKIKEMNVNYVLSLFLHFQKKTACIIMHQSPKKQERV